MEYKGVNIPCDIPFSIYIFFSYIYYGGKIKKVATNAIITKIKNRRPRITKHSNNKSNIRLKKTYKLTSYFANKLFRNDKPCLIRSLILLREAMKLNKDVNLVVGVVKKHGELEGHSWISINGESYMEKEDILSKYTIMKEY